MRRWKVCAPITAQTNEEALSEMERALLYTNHVDMVELRIDYIESPDLKKLLSNKKMPVLITNRIKEEGGNFSGSDELRERYIEEAIELGADYVDIEIHKWLPMFEKRDTKIIASYHNFEHTPSNICSIYKEAAATNCDFVKIVTMAKNQADIGRIYYLLEKVKGTEQLIAFCMGEIGKETRTRSLELGGVLTFVKLPGSQGSAKGQLSLDEYIKWEKEYEKRSAYCGHR
jgi:3-dehydroquinate dehydratase type I